MSLLHKHKFQIIVLLLFAFIFYSGCSATGQLEPEEIHGAKIDSFYYAVTKTYDTIKFSGKTTLKQYENEADVITYQNKGDSLSKTLETKNLKFLYAKYQKNDALGIVLIFLVSLLIIGFVALSKSKFH